MLNLLLDHTKERFLKKSEVTNESVIRDGTMYPTQHDFARTGRGYAGNITPSLPFLANKEFHGTMHPLLFKREYQQRYGEMKYSLEVQTPMDTRMEPHFVGNRQNFVGDYHCPYPDMVNLMQASVSNPHIKHETALESQGKRINNGEEGFRKL